HRRVSHRHRTHPTPPRQKKTHRTTRPESPMTNESRSDKVWALIDEEKRRDQSLRRLAKTAWIVAVTVVVLYGTLTAIQVWEMMQGFLGGMLPVSTAVAMATP